jgi:3-oxoacyl-[acyl-carrier protein] reductase
MAKAEKVRGEAVHRKVVNISSGAGLKGNVGQVNYSSAKAAVIGLTKSLAKEWGRYNVNAVVYGLIRTRLTEALVGGEASIDVEGRKLPVGVNPDLLAQLERGIPLGRAGTPEEAAGAVFLFCLPEANYVSGEVITCGGGW